MPISINGVTYYQMADAVTPSLLPAGMDAYLGYVDGRYADFSAIAKAHGNVPCFGLSVFGNPWTGDGVDSEPGDATIAQAVAFTRTEIARGVDRPIVYCPASWATSMYEQQTAGGNARSKYRLLTAHYDGRHICGPTTCKYGPGSDGTQWENTPGYDLSLLSAEFLNAKPYPGPVGPTTSGVPKGMLTNCIALVSTLSGKGYWEVQADGGVFTHGDAAFYGSLGGVKLAKPVCGAARTLTGKGYYLVAQDGGVFCFGDAAMYGSLGGTKLSAPIVGIQVTPTGKGYWLVGSDGGVFTFGDAAFEGAGS